MEYAGAFLPLYLIRDGSLVEIIADKIIIGMNPEGKSYTDHEIDLKENDIFYIFSIDACGISTIVTKIQI